MKINRFNKVTLLYENLFPLVKTRWPWLHKNFSGVPGWKQGFIWDLERNSEMLEEDRGTTKVLFKFFGYPVILDSSRKELWKYPKVTIRGPSIRAGWLYWAISLSKMKLYYIPRKMREDFKFLADENVLKKVLIEGMKTYNPQLLMDAMNVMRRMGFSNFRMQMRVVSRAGDRIMYSVTYPNTRVIINSVNGIQNQVLAAKYYEILTNIDIDSRKRNLLHKSEMTLQQLEWIEAGD